MSRMLSDVIKDYAAALYAVTPGRELANNLGNTAAPFLQFGNALTGIDIGQIETPEQRGYLKNIILNRIRETGNLSGNELGHSDYDPKSPWSHPDSFFTSAGLFSPNFAYQNTLGAGGFSVPETGGSVDFNKSGTVYDFNKNNGVYGIVNQGGLAKQPLQHYTPDINITPKDIFNIFGGGAMMRVNNEDRPEISSYKPHPLPDAREEAIRRAYRTRNP